VLLLTIRHRTSFRYARPVWLQPHRMMLCPRGQKDLRLLTPALRCVPPAAINTGTATRLAYRVRDEEGTQSPDKTLAKGSGSRRDFATLLIEPVRHRGFSAHAVSGYLQPDAPGDQHGTARAWAEVYLPCAGRISFDPTHGGMGEGRLILVAVAGNIAQIYPVRGSYIGAPEDFPDMEVDVAVETSSAQASAFGSAAF
jgi:transglutaminase-like putative cysteine protease